MQQTIKDDQVPGLFLFNRKTGGQTWYLQKRIGEKVLKFKIGDRLLIDPFQARSKAIEMLRDIEAGRNPIAREQKSRSLQVTVSDLFEQYFTEHLERNTARPAEYRSAYERLWTPIKGIIVGRLETYEIQRWMNKLATVKGQPTANKQLTLLRSCLRWGNTMRIISLEQDPTLGITKFEEIPYERCLDSAEAQRLADTLNDNPGDLSDVVWLAWFTGARQANVIAMRWDELDLEERRWDIPANKMKGRKGRRKTLSLALTDEAISVLRRRQNNSHWVFPNEECAFGHRRWSHKDWDSLRKKAGLEDFHFHGLRHTVASWLGMAGESTLVIQRALGHSTSRMSERYTLLDSTKIRQSLEQSRLRYIQ